MVEDNSYEQILVLRDRDWWTCILDKIQAFYDDMLFYKNPENTNILQNRVNESKKRKKEKQKLNPYQNIY